MYLRLYPRLPVLAVPVGRALGEIPAEIRVIYPEAAQQAEGHDEHDEGERQCHDDRHPEQVEDCRDQQDTDDEFADRASARNPGDEQADERYPGNSPGPVHDGPAREPLFLGALISKSAEGQLYDVRQVVADVLGKRRPR